MDITCLPSYTLNEVLENTKAIQIADKAGNNTLNATLYQHALKLYENEKVLAIGFLKDFRTVIFYIMRHIEQNEIFTKLDLFDAMDAYYRYQSVQPVLNILNSKPRKYFTSQEDAITNIHN